MQIQNWKIFDKKGSYLGLTPSPLIPLVFNSATGKNAEGFLITDVSRYAKNAEITNSGYLYNDNFLTSYQYVFNANTVLLPASNASINTVDVSIYNPEPSIGKAINSITLDLSTKFVYPSVTYAAAIFLNPISKGLVETEHLFILEEITPNVFIRPYDASNSTLILKMIGDDSEIKFFTIDETNAEINWTDELVFDTSLYISNTPITINIGFRAEQAGVYERIIRVYHQVGEALYAIADIAVSAEAIDEDERFRDLLGNVGAPDPKNFSSLFKEADINEDLPDYKLINYKSKHMILEYDKIIPYIGTYKALINAIKWLGYDDIYIREWFKNVKENKKLSFLVPYNATDRTQTILMFNADQRKTLKKLNELSLFYCITRETGEIDLWGTPETENCYSYNLKEVFIKLLALKQWLEKNIIGINCRIIDITGEGVYFERFRNLVTTNDNIGYEYKISQSLSPYSLDKSSELVRGDASIRLSFLELTQTEIKDLPYHFSDFIEYAWSIYDPSICISVDDPSYLTDPSSYLLKGQTINYPFLNITDIQWKLSVEKEHGVIDETMVTNPLFIHENDIRFYNIYDTSSIFYDVSTSLYILLENAYLRDPSIDEWTNSISYSIYPDPSNNGEYIIESSSGEIFRTYGYVSLSADASGKLQYAYDDNYKVPLLSFKNYTYVDSSNVTRTFGSKYYYLDILDGKISIDAGKVPISNSSDNHLIYINWNYDASIEEQMISMNVEYYSPRMKLSEIDPSSYYWSDPSGLSGGTSPTFICDNSIYIMHVNHIGNYNIELFAWDAYNTMFYNVAKETYLVYIKYPTLYFLVDNSSYMGYDVSSFMSIIEVNNLITNNRYPIYDRDIPLQGLTLQIDSIGNPYVQVPSITYFQDVPEENTINRFYNLTERVLTINGSTLTIDADYQKFYKGDAINLVKIDKGKYSLIFEEDSSIMSISGSTLVLDTSLSLYMTIDSSSEVYILNDTYRFTKNVSNFVDTVTVDISGYVFEVGQLVGLIVTDLCTNYSWGASYRVDSINGSTHIFDGLIPDTFVDNPSRYPIFAKHAFSTYSSISAYTKSATEIGNLFKIYLNNSYCQEYYLDNTFVYINTLFDQDLVNSQWYDPSLDLVNSRFYYYDKSIVVDNSTLVILRSIYEPSNYLLNQKNIWTARYNDTNEILFKVYNESVPYIFSASEYFNISVESYDKYGNLIEI